MTPQELIASGNLEAYVLGQLDAADALMVERMAAAHAVVRAELESIEGTLGTFAEAHAERPRSRVKENIMSTIGDDRTLRMLAHPASSPAAAPARTSSWTWLVAASLLAFIMSAGMNFMLYRELKGVRGQLAAINAERAVLAQELQVQRTALQGSQEQLAVVLDPHKRVVPLSPKPIAPDAGARVYWDANTHDLFVDVLSLPPAPTGKQYQLWAQVDGVMVDAGLFDTAADAPRIQRMKSTANATAFGVTLEKLGGSDTPTLTALYLIGPVS